MDKHNKFLMRALDWNRDGSSSRMLLSSGMYVIAQRWLKEWDERIANSTSENLTHIEPLDLQRFFIKKSGLRLRKIKYIIFFVILTVLSALSLLLLNARIEESRRQTAEVINTLEENSNKAIDAFKSDQVSALYSAIESAEALKENMIKNNSKEYITASPILALNKMMRALKDQYIINAVSPVENIEFSPKGDRIAAICNDGFIRVWDNQGNLISQFHAVSESNSSSSIKMGFSEQSDYMYIFDRNSKLVRIWNYNSNQIISTIEEPSANVNAARFSPDGQLLATASEDKTAHLWDLSGRLVAKLEGSNEYVQHVAFNKKGDLIITVDRRGECRTYDLTGKLTSKVSPEGVFIGSKLGVNTQKNQIVVTSIYRDHGVGGSEVGGTSFLYNLDNQSIIDLPTPGIQRFDFSADGKYIVTIDGKSEAQIWDTSGKLLTKLRIENRNDIRFFNAAFDPHNNSIFTIHNDGVMRVWDLQGKMIRSLQKKQTDSDTSLAFNKKNGLMALNDKNIIRFWNFPTESSNLRLNTEAIIAKFSPSEEIVASASNFNPIVLWHFDKKTIVKIEPDCYVTDLGFSKNSQRLLSVCDERRFVDRGTSNHRGIILQVWNLNGKLLDKVSLTQEESRNFTLDINNYYLALNSKEYHLESVKRIAAKVDISEINLPRAAAASSPAYLNGELKPDIDRSFLDMGDYANLLELSGKVIRSFKKTDSIGEFKLSHSGNYVAETQGSNVLLWHVDNKKPIEFIGHSQRITMTDFSHEDSVLATASSDKTTKIWTLSGKLIDSFEDFSSEVFSVNFSHSGNYIVTTTSDTVQVLEVKNLDKLLFESCKWITPYIESNSKNSRKFNICRK